ncbi:MAG TPA: helix-turn-helix transcriptional regulator [Bacteroidia bacterium]|nr:helix-turn-helix transcriptional regulator [Bacteroidia bacterium]
MNFCCVLDETKELKKIGERLQKLRIQNGYGSYEDFAIKNGLSRMQYWRIEKGKTNVTFRSLIVILKIHKISLAKFFSDDF